MVHRLPLSSFSPSGRSTPSGYFADPVTKGRIGEGIPCVCARHVDPRNSHLRTPEHSRVLSRRQDRAVTGLAWQNWGALAVSGTLIASALPPLLLAPLAGVLVDRCNKRQIMIAMDALRAVAILGLLALPLVGSRHWLLVWTYLSHLDTERRVSSRGEGHRPSPLWIGHRYEVLASPQLDVLHRDEVSPPANTVADFKVGQIHPNHILTIKRRELDFVKQRKVSRAHNVSLAVQQKRCPLS